MDILSNEKYVFLRSMSDCLVSADPTGIETEAEHVVAHVPSIITVFHIRHFLNNVLAR